ncbi:MAG: CHASE2 domain-containing protein [Deltaproteobacteria bacterium]|nr:CHASE2 domain-containing protein [Deltaproteobacteria bacterium]
MPAPLITSPGRLAKIKAALALGATAFLTTLALFFGGVLEPYALKTLDLLFRRVPLPGPDPRVVLVTVDQPDVDFYKKQGINWPWPRQLYAPIIEFCRLGGARAVIFDIIYSEPSVYGPEDDQRLGEAAAQAGNVIFPFFLSREEKESGPLEAEIFQKAALEIAGPGPVGLPHYRSLLPPIPPLTAAAATLGNVEAGPDPDSIYRRLPLALPYQGRWLPFLAFAAYQRFQSPGPWRFGEGGLVKEGVRLPLDEQGRMLLKFRGPSRSHRHFSAANVIRSAYQASKGEAPLHAPREVAGAWVFVGLTAPGLKDMKPSPVAPIFTGVELQMTLLDNLLRGDFLRQAPGWLLWAWALGLAAAVSLGVFFSRRLEVTLGVFLVLGGLHLVLAVAAFRLSWWLDPVAPGVALFLAFGGATAYSYATEGRQKQFIRRTFSQYLAETVVNDLLENPDKLRLGGERRRVTLFFSDLAGFTGISEGLTPEELVGLLNDYLSRMTEIIMEEGGTVDKFEGDAIMAFWGAPLEQEDQARRACRAALRQVRALDDLNQSLRSQGLPALAMRIGLHTGEAVVGNLGSAKRFDYTVIGDTVNLASRLEGLNKFYGTAVMASEATRAECGGEVEFMELDQVAVKGRAAPVTVFAVLGTAGELSQLQAEARQEFLEGLSLYRQGRFVEAVLHFERAREHLPDPHPAEVYLERCRHYQAAPPPPGWDGVFRPEKK